MKKISYSKLQELVVFFRSKNVGAHTSIRFSRDYVGIRVRPAGTILSSLDLSVFQRFFKGVCWFIEIDTFNPDYYFISFDRAYLK